MVHHPALDTQIQALIAQIPDVPMMVDPDQVDTVLSTEDATLIMGLPLAWFHAADGRHTIQVNRLLIGLQLANTGVVTELRLLSKATREASSRLMSALMQKLDTVDAATVAISEFAPETPKPRVLVARMDLLNSAARRLNTAPRFLVARIMGRTLH